MCGLGLVKLIIFLIGGPGHCATLQVRMTRLSRLARLSAFLAFSAALATVISSFTSFHERRDIFTLEVSRKTQKVCREKKLYGF